MPTGWAHGGAKKLTRGEGGAEDARGRHARHLTGRLAALKFLGHWLGDIHPPLHAASQDDRGGNHIRTLGNSCESLHTLWDRCIVEERLGMHPLTIVHELRAGITDNQRAEWLAGDPVAWTNESFATARKARDRILRHRR